MWSIPCNVKHLAQEQGQQKIQWSMLWKRTFRHFWLGKYGKLTKKTIWQRHQPNKGNIALHTDRFRALRALRGLRSRRKLSAEKSWEMHFLSNEEKGKWIKDHVDRETAVTRRRVQDTETVIEQGQQYMTNVEQARSTTTKPKTSFREILNAI